MEFAEALVAEELWGWPVDVLDRLLELRQQAWQGQISLEDWRERDAAGRAGLPAFDVDEVRQLQDTCMDEWYGTARDARPDGGDQLIGRLTAMLDPAPTDEELWTELTAVYQALAAPKRERDRRLEEIYRRNRARIAGWLTRPGGGLDPITGLPWSQVTRYRVVDDPDLGPVPQHVELARKLAEDNATAEDRQRAEMVREAGEWRPVAVPMAELHALRMTWLPRLLLDAAEDGNQLQPLLDGLKRIWADPRVQRLLVLETARGWPADAIPEPAAPEVTGLTDPRA